MLAVIEKLSSHEHQVLLLRDAQEALHVPAPWSPIRDHDDRDAIEVGVSRAAGNRYTKVIILRTGEVAVDRLSLLDIVRRTNDVAHHLNEVSFSSRPARGPEAPKLLPSLLVQQNSLTHERIGRSLEPLEVIKPQDDGLRG